MKTHLSYAAAALASLALAPTLATAGTGHDDFEGGVNDAGWRFNAFSDVLESSGGNPGGWLHNASLDTFAPILATGAAASCFRGDYRAMGVESLSVDALTLSTDFPVAGLELSLLLRDTKGTADVSDDDYAYFVGPEIPQPGAGWKSFVFPIPSQDTSATPAGWSGGWAGDCCSFRPGVDWNDVIQNVDRVELWWLNPSFFAIFQNWNVGADNIALHVTGGATIRNGGGTNPLSFASTSAPAAGAAWTSTVDVATPGATASFLAAGLAATSGTVLSGNIHGELLVLPPFVLLDVAAGAHSIPIPADCSLIGQPVFTQAATFLPGDIALSNALDLVIGT